MRRKAGAMLGAALMTLVLAPGALAAERLDRLGVQLRDRPLVIHPDLAWLLDQTEIRRVEETLGRAEVPVLVTLLPLLEQDSSGGDPQRVLLGLIERAGRPGLYVVVDQRGAFHVADDRLGRRVVVGDDLAAPRSVSVSPGDRHSATETVVPRLGRLVAAVGDAPGARPQRPDRDLQPVASLRATPPTSGSDVPTVLAWGALLGVLAYGILRGIVVLRRL